MFEEESKEYANEWLYHVKDLELHHKEDDKPEYTRILEAHQKGAEFGYKKAMEEWKRCFLSCSSPYCSKQFPTVESNGVLGNMEKKENDRV